LGHLRYILEFFRPEIQQYFVADNKSERPFNREKRSLIYERAKAVIDTAPFGTIYDITDVGYEWISHSLAPKDAGEIEHRVTVGGPDCSKPYSASHLNVSAMSFGALSPNAIMALNKGAAMGHFFQNTGEGGLTEYHNQGGDVCFQIGTGYFSVRTKDGHFDEDKFKEKANRSHIKMIEIKLSQGAKPAHGGVLPAKKISKEIAEIRHVEMGKDVISPPAHTAFEGPEGLCQFIRKLRHLASGKPIGFKLCIGKPHEFLSICKAMVKTGIKPDFITVDGAEGGTGAAPVEYTNHIGKPLNEALVFVHNALVGFDLRKHIRVIASGKITTGFDMISKIALGADMCNSARPMMMSVGCIQSRQCNKDTCPVGVATQDPKLYKALDVEDKKHRARNYHDATIKSFKEIMGAMGITKAQYLCPSLVMRRTGLNEIKSYAQIYHYMKPGELLNDNTIPDNWRYHYDLASAENF
jgi:glutamate synthase domain-containing protein 2